MFILLTGSSESSMPGITLLRMWSDWEKEVFSYFNVLNLTENKC